MEVPTSPLKFLYGASFTLSLCGVMVSKTALGDRAAPARLGRFWGDHVCHICGMRVRTLGVHHFVSPAVVMANHQSYMDIPALLEGMPVYPGFLAKKELRRIPFFGRAMELGGSVFVDRGIRQRAFRSIALAGDEVRRGRTIVLFPEGTRSDGQRIKPFKKGGFHLAKAARVPIVPVGIRGTSRVLPKHGKRIRAGEVEVRIGEAIDADVVESATLDALVQLTRGKIAELAGLPMS